MITISLPQPPMAPWLDVGGLIRVTVKGLAKVVLFLVAATSVVGSIIALRMAATAPRFPEVQNLIDQILSRLFG